MGTEPVLSYADLPARWGISVERTASFTRVAIQPMFRWSVLIGMNRVVLLVLGAVISAFVLELVLLRAVESGPLVNALICAGVAVLILLNAWTYLSRYVFFEINAQDFILRTVSALGGGSSWRWPRKDVIEFKPNPSGTKVVIRIAGHDIVQVFVSPNREAAQFVVETLIGGLHAEYDGKALDLPAVPLPFQRTRRIARFICLAFSVIVSVISIVLILYGHCWAVYILPLAAIPAGLILGSQRKELYF